MKTPKIFQSIFGPAMDTATVRFQIQGMSCERCVERVSKSIEQLPGITSAQVDLSAAVATVTYKLGKVSLEEIQQQIRAAGSTATLRSLFRDPINPTATLL